MTRKLLFAIVVYTLAVTACHDTEIAPETPFPADLLMINGYVYTSDSNQSVAEAVAVREGEIIYVGSSEQALELQGADTPIIDLNGRMMMPGLHDVHLHIFDIVEADVCTLRSQPYSLEEMVPVLRECVQRYQLEPGEWLQVDAWNFTSGNQPSERLPTLRVALDAVSTEHPIILWGNDGHHGAVNSAALAQARDKNGNEVGFSAATLAGELAGYRQLVSLDIDREPSGGINEQARFILGSPLYRDPAVLGKLLPQIGHKLARLGITSVQDASLEPPFLDYLDNFEAGGQMHFRIQVATRLDPIDYTDRTGGQVDIDRMITELLSYRDRFSDSPLISASAAKIYFDGVLEGDLLATPPTLPNAAMLEPYKQPRFNFDVNTGTGSLLGYVDTGSELCQQVRVEPASFENRERVATFLQANGFHPGQCTISNGVLRDSVEFVNDYVRRLNDAGFTIHIHVIGDRAVRLAVDALELVMADTAGNPLRHSLAHLQLIHPDDVHRIGALGLYLAYTYAWIVIDPPYDMTVMPFIDEVSDPENFYDMNAYYMQNIYPTRSTMEAGAILVAGSDAPVDELSPRPFVNMAAGISRTGADGRALNAAQAIDIHQMIAAYTINGAHAMKQEDKTGSIEVGKRADFAVLDRNIIDLYEAEEFPGISETRVDITVFDGEIIYTRE